MPSNMPQSSSSSTSNNTPQAKPTISSHSNPPPPNSHSSSPSSSLAGHQTTSSSSSRSSSTSTETSKSYSQPSSSSGSSSNSGSSSSHSSATSSSPASFTPFTSYSTVTGTNGQPSTVIIVTTRASSPTFAAVGTSSGRSSSSNTAAIAGGVVGGAVALGLISLLLFFCVRKRRRARDPFDGDFDPDHLIGAPPERDPTLPYMNPDAAPYAYDTYDSGSRDPYKHADANGMPLPLHHGYDMAQRSDESGGYMHAVTTQPNRVPESPPHTSSPLPNSPLPNPFDSPTRAEPNEFGRVPTYKEAEAGMDRRRLYVTNEVAYDGYAMGDDAEQYHNNGRVPVDLAYYGQPRKDIIPPRYDVTRPDHDLRY